MRKFALWMLPSFSILGQLLLLDYLGQSAGLSAAAITVLVLGNFLTLEAGRCQGASRQEASSSPAVTCPECATKAREFKIQETQNQKLRGLMAEQQHGSS